jgi:hypothetical protein
VAASFFRRVFAERAERINDGLGQANLLRCHITHQDEHPAETWSEFDFPHELRTPCHTVPCTRQMKRLVGGLAEFAADLIGLRHS